MHQLQHRTGRNAHRGFTLAELILVLVIAALLAAFAVPRFLDLRQAARLAALDTLAKALWSTTNTVRVLCRTNPECDYGNASQVLTIGGRAAWLNFGWLDAGDDLDRDQIDAWVDHAGFTATLVDPAHTRFSLTDSPDPVNCSVTYSDAYYRGSAAGIDIAKATSGC